MDPADPSAAARIDRFQVLAGHGRDGAGWIVTARDGRDGALVTLDVLDCDEPRLLKAAVRRIAPAAKLRDRRICAITDIIEHDGRPVVVREHERGISLAQLVESDGPWPPHDASRLVAQLARVLDRAHARGVVHGRLAMNDIRQIVPDGPFKIAGFGRMDLVNYAELPDLPGLDAQSGLDTERVRYLPPEAFAGLPLDDRGDLYALGQIYFTLLAGRPAFLNADAARLAETIAISRMPDLRELAPHAAEDFVRLAESATAREIDERPPTGNAFAEALERAMSLNRPVDIPQHILAASSQTLSPDHAPVRPPGASVVGSPAFLSWLLKGRRLWLMAGLVAAIGAALFFLVPPSAELEPPPDMKPADLLPDDPSSQMSVNEPSPLVDEEAAETPWQSEPQQASASQDDQPPSTGAVERLEDDVVPTAWPQIGLFALDLPCTRIEAQTDGGLLHLHGLAAGRIPSPPAIRQGAADDAMANGEVEGDWLNVIEGADSLNWTLLPGNTRYCELLDLVARFAGFWPERLLRNAQPEAAAAHAVGDLLVLDLDAPLAPQSTIATWFARVDYVTADGRVVRLLPGDSDEVTLRAGESRRIGDPGGREWIRLAAPGGTELAVALFSPAPLELPGSDRVIGYETYLEQLEGALIAAAEPPVATILPIIVAE